MGELMDRDAFLTYGKAKEMGLPDGKTCFIRKIGGIEAATFRRTGKDLLEANEGRFFAMAAAMFLSDASGCRIFTDDDIEQLGAHLPQEILLAVYEEGMKFNLMTKEAQEDAEADFPETQGVDGGSV